MPSILTRSEPPAHRIFRPIQPSAGPHIHSWPAGIPTEDGRARQRREALERRSGYDGGSSTAPVPMITACVLPLTGTAPALVSHFPFRRGSTPV